LGGEASSPEERESAAERISAMNRISTFANEVVLDVDSINLDQDEGEEQILTVRKTDKANGGLWVVVADYLPARRAWIRAWEGETLVTKLTTFAIQAKDLIGDHNLDIVCTGIDDANQQTIVVWKRISDPEKDTLAYSAAAALAADSLIVEELERSEGYQLGQTNGVDWPIVAFRRDKESQNILDQIKTVYSWDFSKGSYVESATQRIPGAQVEKNIAAKVLTGNEGDFESFLRGVWYESSAGPLDSKAKLIVFDRSGGSITFYSSEAQEVFRWLDSHSTRNGLYVGSQNESVSNLRRLMDIELAGADTITVRVFEDLKMKVDAEDLWNGTYRKLPDGTSGPEGRSARGNAPFTLAGLWRSADGSEMAFGEGRRFRLTRPGKNEAGGYSLYSIGSDAVLEFVVLKDNGLIETRRSYRALYTETKKGKSTQRILRLVPARVAIVGLELLEEPVLSFEQRLDG